MSDLIRLDDVRDIPDMSIGPEHLADNGWRRVQLTDPAYAIPPDPPTVLGLLYTGKRHVISGPPESTKTLIAYLLLIAAIRDGRKVAIVDFEMGPTAARRMLDDLGATLPEIADMYYVEPDTPPEDGYRGILEHGAELVLLDAAAGAYDTSGLDDNARKDAEQFARVWIRPLWQAGVTSVIVDHVTKDAAARGKFTIGSERKVGQADVHLSCDAIKPLSRGHDGLVRVTVHKDRPGFLQRPTAAIFELHSHPDTHQITYQLREHDTGDDDSWKPTILMERVSKFLEQHAEPVSRTQIETTVKGKSAKHIRQAIDHLIVEGFAAETPGPRNARNVSCIRPFRHENPTPSDPVPPRPDGVTTTPSDSVPLTGAETGSTAADEHDPVRNGDGDIDIYDPTVQALLDDDIPL